MALFKNYLFIIILLSTSVIFAQQQENPFTIKWDKGLKVESLDKQFKMKFGGRIMVDHAFFSQDKNLDINFNPLTTTSGTELRRARIFTSGTLYGNVDFKFSIDFSGNLTTVKDAYISVNDIPYLGTVRAGHLKEPFSLEALSSSKYLSFMERPFSDDFVQQRNNGILVMNDFYKKRLSVQAGYFFNEDNSSDDKAANGGYAITARVSGLLIDNKKERKILQVATAYSYRKPSSKTYRIESRPEAHLSRLKYIFTGPISSVRNLNLINLELLYINNSFSFQSEYLSTTINTGISNPTDTYGFATYYGQVSYYVTGESKRLKNSYDGMDRISPNKNYGKSGPGALELALRYSSSDLNDQDIFGGEQHDITIGVNWYLNPATRLMANNVFADISGKGKANIFQLRFQIDF
ncbi:ATPase [Polaribacter pacificus]|uniref:ATPase n=1 Tax=Polaribacter pacificus TaxID=1775173 RepID=A0A917HXQ5_9FLAO|nr:porin [Polaribacter pacificus]GGG94513.1 ATPase [Polaribacter pacificus]